MVLHLKWVAAICILSNFAVITRAQAEAAVSFKKQKIEITQNQKKTVLNVELAETNEQHSKGLMFREKLGANEGMLFVFEDEKPREFWMKNTLINLDIAYFDKNKILVDLQQMRAVTTVMQKEIPTYPSKTPAMYALEMPKFWFKKNKFTTGAKLKILAGP